MDIGLWLEEKGKENIEKREAEKKCFSESGFLIHRILGRAGLMNELEIIKNSCEFKDHEKIIRENLKQAKFISLEDWQSQTGIKKLVDLTAHINASKFNLHQLFNKKLMSLPVNDLLRIKKIPEYKAYENIRLTVCFKEV